VSRTDMERIRDILKSIEAIDRAEATVRRYPADPDIAAVALDAVQRRVFTIGEAVKALSPDLRAGHPGVPWSDIARMRDLIGHHTASSIPRSFVPPSVSLSKRCESCVKRSWRIRPSRTWSRTGRELPSRELVDHSGIVSTSSLSLAIMSFISARLSFAPSPASTRRSVGDVVRTPRVTSSAFKAA
jgi:uncharacterized protein with HEPN domain